MLRLLVTHGHEELVFAAPAGEATLGSTAGNDIVLRIRGVSRRHTLVRRCPEGIELVDLGSKNGLLVEGRRVDRAMLTPGLRIQIGAAWLELQELSSEEVEFALCLANQRAWGAITPETTASTEPRLYEGNSSPEAALRLACHLSLVEANTLEERSGLISRLRTALGAEVLVSFKRQRKGAVDIREFDGGRLSAEEERLLGFLAGESRACSHAEVRLKRMGAFLLAGRDSYFLAARFPEESLAREAWRTDFLRFLVARFLVPVEPLRSIGLTEIRRVLTATGGNKSETARILGITRQTIYTAIKRNTRKDSKS
jgi:hypothetical protein